MRPGFFIRILLFILFHTKIQKTENQAYALSTKDSNSPKHVKNLYILKNVVLVTAISNVWQHILHNIVDNLWKYIYSCMLRSLVAFFISSQPLTHCETKVMQGHYTELKTFVCTRWSYSKLQETQI